MAGERLPATLYLQAVVVPSRRPTSAESVRQTTKPLLRERAESRFSWALRCLLAFMRCNDFRHTWNRWKRGWSDQAQSCNKDVNATENKGVRALTSDPGEGNSKIIVQET